MEPLPRTDEATAPPAPAERFEALRREGNEAVSKGDLELALDRFERSLEAALEDGDPSRIDRAVCNRATVLIPLGRSEEVLAPLRRILTAGDDAENRRLAAYHLARAYELRRDVKEGIEQRRDLKKGFLYARIAHRLTRDLPDPDPEWLASSLNQLGNFLVAESYFEEAAAAYEEALTVHPGAPALRRAHVECNLGYCKVCLGEPRAGLGLLQRALRALGTTPLLPLRMRIHLDLCYTHLEIGRLRHALSHGRRALALGHELGDRHVVQNALYLLGETAHRLDGEQTARHWFEQLQTHFPDTPYLTDFLLAIDVRSMINLRA